ncbi:MAG TPA: GNAT family N-acetyltransferase [Roseiarcus sp.]|nr:GNAT family N-acetyltransferase [Roseiarcus sp.]
MNLETRCIDAAGGPYRLRPATPADEAFQCALFRDQRAPLLRHARLPGPAIDNLLDLQRRARSSSYRENFPAARWLIVERDDEQIGELIVDAREDGAHIVDITLHPRHQGRGIGPALVRAVMDASGQRGVSALADVGNAPSRRMFARLGFVEGPCGDGANVELRWRP